MTTLHDVLRWMVRGGRPNTEENQRLALLAIDAHERGYPDAETYQEELNRQAEAARAPEPAPEGESDAQAVARLEAELERARALQAALANPVRSEPPG